MAGVDIVSSKGGGGGDIPKVVTDPRFRAGRRLLSEANQSEAAIQVFTSLLKEAEKTYGGESIETAPVFYEYGNALFRHYVASLEVDDDDQQQPQNVETITTSNGAAAAAAATVKVEEMDTPAALKKRREAAAAAAEKRFQKPSAESSNLDDDDKKPAAIPSPKPEKGSDSNKKDDEPATTHSNDHNGEGHDNNLDIDQKLAVQDGEVDNDEEGEDNDEDDDDDDDDIHLSLEMMEQAYSILEEYLEINDGREPANNNKNTQSRNYRDWAYEQQSRVLTGIGDVLSTMEQHADAAYAYFRALELRQERLKQEHFGNDDNNKDKMTFEYLRSRRLIVESNILFAQELLACTPDTDVITSETKVIVVRAVDRVDMARQYYDTSQDELQETVLLLKQLTAAAGDDDDKKNNLAKEKNTIAHVATLVMGVGQQLAQIDEEKQAAESQPPVKKKAKR